MREIEFRGMRIDNKEWVHGYVTEGSNNTACIHPHFYHTGYLVRLETVSQYIGIKDIHDTKVFQGDIVRCKETIYKDCSKKEIKEVREFVGEVVWYQYGWYIAEKIKEVIPKGIKTGIKFHNLLLWNIEDNKDDTMEILGNRWDNPDMAVVESA